MSSKLSWLCCVILFFIACENSLNPVPPINGIGVEGFPKIDRRPPPTDFSRGEKVTIPKYDPQSTDPFQIDFRSFDLSALNLKNSLAELLYSNFNSKTIWPSLDKLPLHFDAELIMDLGKNPGPGVRSLHEKGITGRNIGIAIIDQTLLTEHIEYADRLQLYEELNVMNNSTAQMHGCAVTSIAVGHTVGVAPEANLFYIGSELNGRELEDGRFALDFSFYAQGVRRILEINELLPLEKKIRVISMSVGWSNWETGYSEIMSAVNEAKAKGLLVVCSSIEEVHGFKFHGLGRFPLSNPDNFEAYVPGSFWDRGFYRGVSRYNDRLLIPMDSRTTASETGAFDYVFYRMGGWSWAIPYIAGIYALAVQVDPVIDPEKFWSLALATGRTITISYQGENIALGPILDPVALINSL